MTPQEQEQFFRRVRAKYRRWLPLKVSGYVHGVVDEERRDRPQLMMILRASDQPPVVYSHGYLAGFADARGPDVLKEQWWKDFGLKLEYLWWKEKD